MYGANGLTEQLLPCKDIMMSVESSYLRYYCYTQRYYSLALIKAVPHPSHRLPQ